MELEDQWNRAGRSGFHILGIELGTAHPAKPQVQVLAGMEGRNFGWSHGKIQRHLIRLGHPLAPKGIKVSRGGCCTHIISQPAESLVLSQAWGRLLLDKPGLDCSSLARHTDGSCHRRLLARMVRPIMGAPALPAHQGGLQDALGSAKLSSPSTCSGNLVHIVCGR